VLGDNLAAWRREDTRVGFASVGAGQ
jgi:hypothetical protein